jgi:hypothetical protein
MIGEAIAGSELAAMLKEHASELRAGSGALNSEPPTKRLAQK